MASFLDIARLAVVGLRLQSVLHKSAVPKMDFPDPAINPMITEMVGSLEGYMPDLSQDSISKMPTYTVPALPPATGRDVAHATGIGCIPCSRDHMSAVSAALNESLRFARENGIAQEEVQRRLALAEDELNIAERIDLAPDKLAEIPEEDKEITREALSRMRAIRQKLPKLTSVEELEEVAAEATRLRLKLRMHSLPAEIREKLMATAKRVQDGELGMDEAKQAIKGALSEALVSPHSQQALAEYQPKLIRKAEKDISSQTQRFHPLPPGEKREEEKAVHREYKTKPAPDDDWLVDTSRHCCNTLDISGLRAPLEQAIQEAIIRGKK